MRGRMLLHTPRRSTQLAPIACCLAATTRRTSLRIRPWSRRRRQDHAHTALSWCCRRTRHCLSSRTEAPVLTQKRYATIVVDNSGKSMFECRSITANRTFLARAPFPRRRWRSNWCETLWLWLSRRPRWWLVSDVSRGALLTRRDDQPTHGLVGCGAARQIHNPCPAGDASI